MDTSKILKIAAGSMLMLLLCVLLLGVLVAEEIASPFKSAQAACQVPLPDFTKTAESQTAYAQISPTATSSATANASPTSVYDDNPCYTSSRYANQVVAEAQKVAATLVKTTSCTKYQGECGLYSSFTNSFPADVSAYGQSQCKSSDCSIWESGNYQCVSFVRGVYSQVFPMILTNDAFNLWATYASIPGWQEVKAGAADNPQERGLPHPGDVMVFKHGNAAGHVAIVISVTAPRPDGTNGDISFASANALTVYDHLALLPNLGVDTLDSPRWGSTYTVWGYLRPKSDAASGLTRIDQSDARQYASTAEMNTWEAVDSSTAVTTEVLNAYGLNLRLHDVLVEQEQSGFLSSDKGLLASSDLATFFKRLDFTATILAPPSLQQILIKANNGTPVIVGIRAHPPQAAEYLVVTGGDGASISVVDSSNTNRQHLTAADFTALFDGFALVVVPVWVTPIA